MTDSEMEIALHSLARKLGNDELRTIADRLADLAHLAYAVRSRDDWLMQKAIDKERYGE